MHTNCFQRNPALLRVTHRKGGNEIYEAADTTGQEQVALSLKQFTSVAQSCPALCEHMGCSTPGFPVHHQFPELAQTHVHQARDAIQPSYPRCPLLLLPSIFPSIRVISNESVLHIRRPKDCSFSFNISPSNEYSGLISFRIEWLDFLAVQGTLKNLL